MRRHFFLCCYRIIDFPPSPFGVLHTLGLFHSDWELFARPQAAGKTSCQATLRRFGSASSSLVSCTHLKRKRKEWHYIVVQVSFMSGRMWWWWLSPLARILGECATIHSPPAFFFSFFLVEISSRTLIPLSLSGSVHSGSPS